MFPHRREGRGACAAPCFLRAMLDSAHDRFVRAGLVAVLLATEAAAAAETTPAVPWRKDFKAALREARTTGKPVIVDFWAKWCERCHKLDATTYRDEKVVALLREFVPVKVDTEGSGGERELSAQHGVETLPTIAFLSPAAACSSAMRLSKDPRPFPRSSITRAALPPRSAPGRARSRATAMTRPRCPPWASSSRRRSSSRRAATCCGVPRAWTEAGPPPNASVRAARWLARRRKPASATKPSASSRRRSPSRRPIPARTRRRSRSWAPYPRAESKSLYSPRVSGSRPCLRQ